MIHASSACGGRYILSLVYTRIASAISMNPPTFSLTAVVLCFLCSCTHYKTQQSPNLSTYRKFAPQDLGQTKTLKVFFDGTANDWQARTNVRRMFEVNAQAEDPQYPCLYLEGVGTTSLAGKALGLGMKDRILDAYVFLAKNWSKSRGDKIQIYGFSRGAFQARNLAGLMAHCGLPDGTSEKIPNDELKKLANRIWDYSVEHLTDPAERANGSQIPLRVWEDKLAANQREVRQQPFCNKQTFNYPTIQFMGIWDTVPGLALATLKADGEVVQGKHQRYKVRPYPNTKVIVHALSLDEQRSRFQPLIVGPAIDPSTKVYEVWFPGAHSDIGGGYSDSNDMSGTTLNWMQDVMVNEHIVQEERKLHFYGDAHGILHHPENDRFSSFGSHSKARTLPSGSHVDFSVFKRANLEKHPEENRGIEVPYEPVIQIAAPAQTDGSPSNTRTMTIKRQTWQPAEAKRALAEYDLDLYDRDRNLDNHPTGNPLSIGQMSVPVNSVEVPAKP